MLTRTEPRTLDCPACGRATAHQWLYAKNGCDILRCRDCGLGRAAIASFDPASYYTADYFSGQHQDGYVDYLGAEQVLRREFAHTAKFAGAHFPRGKLLELGCAYGFFLQEAKRFFDVAGLELAEEAAAYCRGAGLNVLSGVADESTLERFGMVDVIVLLDVIEHLPDPLHTLTLCERFLSPGGGVVLTTGDFASLYARLAGARWRLMTPPQHLWFFTPESMRRLSASLGMRVEVLDHPWKIVPLSLIVFQFRRMLGLRSAGQPTTSRVGVPVNLFDAMRVVLRKPRQP